jgi:hypothetical protein
MSADQYNAPSGGGAESISYIYSERGLIKRLDEFWTQWAEGLCTSNNPNTMIKGMYDEGHQL